MAKAWRTSQRSKATRICGVLPIYLLQSQGEKQQCLSFVYWTIFATLSLIYWPACLILVCMYFNKHCGSFKKKKSSVQSPKNVIRLFAFKYSISLLLSGKHYPELADDDCCKESLERSVSCLLIVGWAPTSSTQSAQRVVRWPPLPSWSTLWQLWNKGYLHRNKSLWNEEDWLGAWMPDK